MHNTPADGKVYSLRTIAPLEHKHADSSHSANLPIERNRNIGLQVDIMPDWSDYHLDDIREGEGRISVLAVGLEDIGGVNDGVDRDMGSVCSQESCASSPKSISSLSSSSPVQSAGDDSSDGDGDGNGDCDVDGGSSLSEAMQEYNDDLSHALFDVDIDNEVEVSSKVLELTSDNVSNKVLELTCDNMSRKVLELTSDNASLVSVAIGSSDESFIANQMQKTIAELDMDWKWKWK